VQTVPSVGIHVFRTKRLSFVAMSVGNQYDVWVVTVMLDFAHGLLQRLWQGCRKPKLALPRAAQLTDPKRGTQTCTLYSRLVSLQILYKRHIMTERKSLN